MNKKFLNMALCLMLMAVVMSLIAVPAFAAEQGTDSTAEEYPLWVGSVQVTSGNAADVLGDGTVRLEVADGKYTLTLENADISETSTHTFAGSTYSSNIYSPQEELDLTIKLIGENRLSNAEMSIWLHNKNYRDKLTICGDGSLNIETFATGPYFMNYKKSITLYGMRGSLVVKNTTIKAEGDVSTNGGAVEITDSYFESGTMIAGDVTIKDSVIDLTECFDAAGNLNSLTVKGKSHVAFHGETCALSADTFTAEDGNELLEPEGGVFKAYNYDVTKAVYESKDSDTVAKEVVIGQHFWEWIVDKEPTCSDTGLKHEECTVCHAKRNEGTSVPSTGEHTWVYQGFSWFVNEQTGRKAAQADFTCSVCDHKCGVFVDNQYLEITVTEPTCMDQGYTTYTAVVDETRSLDGQKHSDSCKEEYTPVMPDNHTLVHKAEDKGTCIKEGTREYWTCSVCGKLFSDENGKNLIDQPERYFADHEWNDPVLSFDDDGSAEVTLVCKNDPEHTRTLEAEVEDTEIVAPTESKDGSIIYTVSYELDGQKLTNKIAIVIPHAGDEVTYSYDGEPVSWTKGSGKSVVLRFSRSEFDEFTYDFFTGFYNDGTSVGAGNYEAEKGSVVITLNADYLETLSEGEHTIKAGFTDGSAETVLTVKVEQVPATGVDDHMKVYSFIVAVSLLSLAAVLQHRKKSIS